MLKVGKFRKEKGMITLNMTNQKLRVFYGLERLNKVIKKPAVCIIFENSQYDLPEKNLSRVKKRMEIVYCRLQTELEKEDAQFKNRILTKYSMTFERYGYDIDFLLNDNWLADENNVSKQERDKIKKALKNAINKRYTCFKNNIQLNIQF